ncbi:MAG: hypothetical protein L0Y71_25390 [Gemmataceae bacterium]|nr:hypothetical protein [Gemmataceae bacterium]
MKKRMLACAVLAAGLYVSDAPAQETLKTQPTPQAAPVIRYESAPRGPIRRALNRREIIQTGATMPAEPMTKVEQSPPITTAPSQSQVVERRSGLLSRLRARLGRS